MVGYVRLQQPLALVDSVAAWVQPCPSACPPHVVSGGWCLQISGSVYMVTVFPKVTSISPDTGSLIGTYIRHTRLRTATRCSAVHMLGSGTCHVCSMAELVQWQNRGTTHTNRYIDMPHTTYVPVDFQPVSLDAAPHVPSLLSQPIFPAPPSPFPPPPGGQAVTIRGSGFSSNTSDNTVMLHGAPCTVTSATDSKVSELAVCVIHTKQQSLLRNDTDKQQPGQQQDEDDENSTSTDRHEL